MFFLKGMLTNCSVLPDTSLPSPQVCWHIDSDLFFFAGHSYCVMHSTKKKLVLTCQVLDCGEMNGAI